MENKPLNEPIKLEVGKFYQVRDPMKVESLGYGTILKAIAYFDAERGEWFELQSLVDSKDVGAYHPNGRLFGQEEESAFDLVREVPEQ